MTDPGAPPAQPAAADILAALPAPVVVVDAADRILALNAEARAVVHITAEEAVGSPFRDRFIGTEPFLGARFAVHASTLPPLVVRYAGTSTSTGDRVLAWSRARCPCGDGEAGVWTAMDITGRVQVEAELHSAYRETVGRLARAVEFRDNDTGEHIERMSGYCCLIAERLQMPRERCDLIREASVMHDAGKIAIPDRILLKPGPLDFDERAIMETHTTVGHDLLAGSTSPLLQASATIALCHHERFDGTGYPSRLRGGEIPVEGRIAAVADVFEALTADRVYRRALTWESAIEVMEAERGTHFDPAILDAFLDGITAGREA